MTRGGGDTAFPFSPFLCALTPRLSPAVWGRDTQMGSDLPLSPSLSLTLPSLFHYLSFTPTSVHFHSLRFNLKQLSKFQTIFIPEPICPSIYSDVVNIKHTLHRYINNFYRGSMILSINSEKFKAETRRWNNTHVAWKHMSFNRAVANLINVIAILRCSN